MFSFIHDIIHSYIIHLVVFASFLKQNLKNQTTIDEHRHKISMIAPIGLLDLCSTLALIPSVKWA